MNNLSFSLESYQLISYILTLGLFGSLLYLTKRTAKYSTLLFAGFAIWALAHLAGMGVKLNGRALYSQIIIPLSNNLPIIRYDQIVHMFGFGIATLMIYELIGHRFKSSIDKFSLGFTIVMAGLGIGAVNEIFEFAVSLLAPDNNIGQYQNTSLDLVADLIGGLLMLALIFNRQTSSRSSKSTPNAPNGK